MTHPVVNQLILQCLGYGLLSNHVIEGLGAIFPIKCLIHNSLQI